MPKYVVAVYPGSASKGLKMSRDVTVEAENIHIAKEMVQNWNPGAKVIVRRELPGSVAVSGSGSDDGARAAGVALGHLAIWLGGWVGLFFKTYAQSKIRHYFHTPPLATQLVSIGAFVILMYAGSVLFGLVGLLLPFVFFFLLPKL